MLLRHLYLEGAGLVVRAVRRRERQGVRLPQRPEHLERDEAVLEHRIETEPLVSQKSTRGADPLYLFFTLS